jgi:hypothetical protein
MLQERIVPQARVSLGDLLGKHIMEDGGDHTTASGISSFGRDAPWPWGTQDLESPKVGGGVTVLTASRIRKR